MSRAQNKAVPFAAFAGIVFVVLLAAVGYRMEWLGASWVQGFVSGGFVVHLILHFARRRRLAR